MPDSVPTAPEGGYACGTGRRQAVFAAPQIAALEAERRAMLHTSQEAPIEKVQQLLHLSGIGINGAWLLVWEFFGWRALKNRREVGG